MSEDRKTYGFGTVFSLMLKYKSGIVIVVLLNILWSFFQLCFPFLTRSLVDSGIQYSDMEVVVIILISQRLLFIGIQIADVLRRWILRHIGCHECLDPQIIIELLDCTALLFNVKKGKWLFQNHTEII